MTDRLRDLLRDEAERIDVPPPPVSAIVKAGQQRTGVRRGRVLVAVAACVALIVGGWAGVNRFRADDARDPTPDVATNAPSPTPGPTPSPTPTEVPGSLKVSGSGVADQEFGADADAVVTAVTARLGSPDLAREPVSYSRIDGSDGWFEVAGDPISLSWNYPTFSVTCWGQLCLLFGGDDADTLRLRGWELQEISRWSPTGEATDFPPSDLRLAGTGIELGDSWKKLQTAYPEAEAGGGEGASLVVANLPWPGVFDGVGQWRLSGQWDFERPTFAPADSKVTRLSGGEGPEPGCC